ncbi:S-layer homology domain-containing protein, partial [Acinetobacter baumannii]|uniref:S-layer homology domain-containing protein n=1 Tax=Acinetobacter baumannii TaxID=470 RepID=UPI001488064C
MPNVKAQRTYKDIVKGSELDRVVSKLQGAGVLNGYEDGTVRPSSAIKAGEAIALIGGALGIP